jgi:hypothetical protein
MTKHIRRKPPGDYEVGYGRTPEHTRFPHQKVSRRTRKRHREVGMGQVMAEFFSALETPVTVTRNGKRKRITASAAIFEQLIAQAALGKAWAARRVIDLQLALTREHDEQYAEMLNQYLTLEEQEKTSGRRLKPEAEALKQELKRRLSNPRDLFEDSDD